jgi:hypothetical protein
MTIQAIPEVLIAADSYDLVDLDTARDELKIDPTDTTNDAWLARAITQVSGLIQDYVKRPFAVETMRDRFDLRQEPRRYLYRTPGVTLLQLSRWPLAGICQVSQTTAPGETSDLVDGADYLTDSRKGQLTRLDPQDGVAITWQAQSIAVVYDAGYDQVPPTIVDAVLRLVVNRWHSRGRDPLLLETVQPGFGTQRWWVGGPKGGGTLPSEVQGMLDIYRPPTLG